MNLTNTELQPRRNVPAVRIPVTWRAIAMTVLAGMALWVFLQVEVPLLLGMDAEWSARIRPYELLLHAHAACGMAALAAGAVQFFPGLRRAYPQLHRRSGYWYAGSVAAAAPLAMWVALRYTPPGEAPAHMAQASLWILTTVAAVLAIRARLTGTHQRWVARSYALTLTFVLSRFITEVLSVRVPAEAGGNATFIWLSTIAVLLIADMAVSRN
jgi:Predicted membrane protein (DUF2306)